MEHHASVHLSHIPLRAREAAGTQPAPKRLEGLLCGIFDTKDNCRIKSPTGHSAACSLDPLGWISACAPAGLSPTSQGENKLMAEGSDFPASDALNGS